VSTVLWANVLVGGVVRSEQEDRSALYRYAEKLDTIAKSLGLPSVLAICDETDVRFNMEDLDLPDGMESTNDVMAASGAWLPRADALSLLQGLLAHIQAAKTRFGLVNNRHQSVVDELSGVLAFLQAEPQAEKFNFCVVM
jgi:hypothetical protein